MHHCQLKDLCFVIGQSNRLLWLVGAKSMAELYQCTVYVVRIKEISSWCLYLTWQRTLKERRSLSSVSNTETLETADFIIWTEHTRDLYNTYILHTSCIHLTYPTCTLGVVKKHEKCDWNDLRCFSSSFASMMIESTLFSL